MPAFEYTACDVNGREKRGVLDSDSPRQARQQLRQQGLIPVDVTAVVQKKEGYLSNPFKARIQSIGIDTLALLLRHLATLLAASMPLEEALFAVAEQSERATVKKILLSVRARILEGHSLADGMREFPNVFPVLCSVTVAAGEQSGHLDEVLLHLADYVEQQQRIRQKVQQALIYPALMSLISLSIVAFLLAFVVPKMVAVFSDSGQTLPLMTRLLMGASHFMMSSGLFVLFGIVLLYIVWKKLMRQDKYCWRRDYFVLKLPVIGYVTRLVNSARFMRTLGILSSAGVPVIESMQVASALMTNLPMNAAVQRAISHVKEGINLHDALKQVGYFSPISIHLIANGEVSGRLEMMLARAATQEEGAVTRLIDTGLSLFEPLLILFMGGVVLFIVLAILLPIFTLYQFIG